MKTTLGLTTFSSESEFRSYLLNSSWMLKYLPRVFITSFSLQDVGLRGGVAAIPERISATNVQIAGIDEPDIAKTDGVNIYFSPRSPFYLWWMPGFRTFEEVPGLHPETLIVRVFPPENLSVRSRINKTGDMFLVDKVLVIFSGSEIIGYDVSNPDYPLEIWSLQVNGSIIAARLHQGAIYFVTQIYVYPDTVFPLTLIKAGNEDITVRVSEIYKPLERIPVDALFTVAILDPRQGKITKKLSFVGTFGTSIFYMSRNALYITYTYYPPPSEVYHRFIKEKCRDVLSGEDMLRIDKLMALEIGEEAKLLELETILQPYLEKLPEKARGYFAERARELQLTGIIKIAPSLEIVAQGKVPGYPLNQFSLDEFGGYLRLATTIEPFIWMFGDVQSANDIYVLDEKLRVVGSVKDLGLTERIYAVRFIGEKGYVVTFRETDPFYLLDFSDPANPKLTGELKIPGYSSYLHPIKENLILGIGRENWKVKISLFDVSDPSQPVELHRLILDEYWSDVLETHHAFLLDPNHEIFFLPAGGNGYVFSYKNSEIVPLLKIEILEISRAIYLNDFLYLIGLRGIVVFDENTWQKIGEITLE